MYLQSAVAETDRWSGRRARDDDARARETTTRARARRRRARAREARDDRARRREGGGTISSTPGRAGERERTRSGVIFARFFHSAIINLIKYVAS